MSLNHYTTLGRSGLRVSPLCLGTMTFGLEWGWGSDVETSQRIMDAYISRGGNFLDTANMYTKGHSEKIIGDHIGRHAAKRERVVIATKFFGNMFGGDPNGGGGGRKSMMAACEHSLRRLQTDYIDLYWLHCWDRFTPIEETMRGLDDLVRAGKVRYIGFSDTPAWKCAQAQMLARQHGWTPVIALQVEYSLLERTVEGEIFPAAAEMGMGITPWSPLAGGALTGKFTRDAAKSPQPGRGEWVTRRLNERTFKIIDAVQKVANELKTGVAQVSLAWVREKTPHGSTIFGARTMEQLESNLSSADVTLSAEHIATLDEVSKPTLNFPFEFVKNSGQFMHGGSTVNGETAAVWPMAPQGDAERY